MATTYPNYKRRTPCASVKAGFKNPATVTIYCRCCGEWERAIDGRIQRYIERVW